MNGFYLTSLISFVIDIDNKEPLIAAINQKIHFRNLAILNQ